MGQILILSLDIEKFVYLSDLTYCVLNYVMKSSQNVLRFKEFFLVNPVAQKSVVSRISL